MSLIRSLATKVVSPAAWSVSLKKQTLDFLSDAGKRRDEMAVTRKGEDRALHAEERDVAKLIDRGALAGTGARSYKLM